MVRLGKIVSVGESIADHPVTIRLFGWLMSQNAIQRRMTRRTMRRAARSERRRLRRG